MAEIIPIYGDRALVCFGYITQSGDIKEGQTYVEYVPLLYFELGE